MELSWESLAKILEELIPNEVKLREMGQRALNTSLQRFSPMLQAERTLSFYRKLLKNMKK